MGAINWVNRRVSKTKEQHLDLDTCYCDHEGKWTPVDDQAETADHQPSEDEPSITKFNVFLWCICWAGKKNVFLTYFKAMVIGLVLDKSSMQPDNIIPPLAGKPRQGSINGLRRLKN